MKNLCLAIAFVGLLSLNAAGQNGATGSSSGNTTNAGSGSGAPTKLAAGTIFQAQLTKSLDAKKAKAGDGVEAKTWEDVLSDGIVIVPRGSKLIGHLTEAQAPASAKKASQ